MEPLSPGRRILFWSIMLLLPFVFLLALEGALRLAHYGDDLDLVLTTHAFGRDWYTLNTAAGKRYFSQAGIAVPELYDELFELHKQPNTKRIFLLGESTMAGFPFDYAATPSRLLQTRLQMLLPQYKIEVVNAAMSAVNSFTVLDCIGELARYEPDAFVVYVGHNEFYGALGVASSESFGRNRTLTKLVLRLRTVKVVQLLKNVIALSSNAKGQTAAPRDASLMEVLAHDKTIPYGSTEYLLARETFEANLREIIGVARARDVPIVVSTLASNIRDQEPFQPSFSPSTPEEARGRWNALVRSAADARGRGALAEAASDLRLAVALDTLQADSHFRLAQCLAALGDTLGARSEFERARDDDALRFRASGEFNGVIRTVCRDLSTPVADADSAFAAASPGGLVGSNLMMEHLHPNFNGYLLLAKTFASALGANGILAGADAYRWASATDDAVRRNATVTPFDLEVANERIRDLTGRWPFHCVSQAIPPAPADSALRSVVERYARKKIIWSEAHFELAGKFLAEKNYDAAIAEYRSVASVVPYSYYSWMMMGDAYQLAGLADSAGAMYRQAIDAEDSPYAHVRLGMLDYEAGKTDLAIAEFERTIARESEGREKMHPKEVSVLRYFLGSSYGKLGDIAKAKLNLQIAVQIDPSNRDAKNMLAQIP